ncbi:BolA/IbaG family iron-sulfur metabolism protein [Moritella viscosa]
MVNTALVTQFEAGIHALSIHAYTPEQWAKKNDQDQKIPESPDCLG